MSTHTGCRDQCIRHLKHIRKASSGDELLSDFGSPAHLSKRDPNASHASGFGRVAQAHTLTHGPSITEHASSCALLVVKLGYKSARGVANLTRNGGGETSE